MFQMKLLQIPATSAMEAPPAVGTRTQQCQKKLRQDKKVAEERQAEYKSNYHSQDTISFDLKNFQHSTSDLKISQAVRCFLESCWSAFSSFVIFSAMDASSASATSLLWRANACAANFAILDGFRIKALEDPGGFVRQVIFIPSGGQDTTGNLAKYDAVPDNASVPPAQPIIITGRVDLLYSAMTDCNRPGCLCAEQIRISASILNFPVV